MSFFKQKNNVVKTGSAFRPSERFAQVLSTVLEKEGYKFLKSKNEFVQEFEYGKRIISLYYPSSFGYISTVECFYKIIFTDLEKRFKKVFPQYGWTNWTIHYNLMGIDSWLCDKNIGEYTDETINKVAKEFFEKVKPQIDSLRDKFSDYRNLNAAYNKRPIEFFEYLPFGRIEKRIINGLILIKAFQPSQYEEFKTEYRKHFEKFKGDDKEELRIEIEQGIEYLDKNDIGKFCR
jgi:hypothetical protein